MVKLPAGRCEGVSPARAGGRVDIGEAIYRDRRARDAAVRRSRCPKLCRWASCRGLWGVWSWWRTDYRGRDVPAVVAGGGDADGVGAGGQDCASRRRCCRRPACVCLRPGRGCRACCRRPRSARRHTAVSQEPSVTVAATAPASRT